MAGLLFCNFRDTGMSHLLESNLSHVGSEKTSVWMKGWGLKEFACNPKRQLTNLWQDSLGQPLAQSQYWKQYQFLEGGWLGEHGLRAEGGEQF